MKAACNLHRVKHKLKRKENGQRASTAIKKQCEDGKANDDDLLGKGTRPGCKQHKQPEANEVYVKGGYL
jgi:hypothetical protein